MVLPSDVSWAKRMLNYMKLFALNGMKLDMQLHKNLYTKLHISLYAYYRTTNYHTTSSKLHVFSLLHIEKPYG